MFIFFVIFFVTVLVGVGRVGTGVRGAKGGSEAGCRRVRGVRGVWIGGVLCFAGGDILLHRARTRPFTFLFYSILTLGVERYEVGER